MLDDDGEWFDRETATFKRPESQQFNGELLWTTAAGAFVIQSQDKDTGDVSFKRVARARARRWVSTRCPSDLSDTDFPPQKEV